MNFEKQTMHVTIDPAYKQGSSLEGEGYIATGTGLGYYIDTKPEEGVYPAFEVNGQTVYREHDETRYCPQHIASGMGFGLWFYQEEQVRAFLEAMAPILDWTQPLNELAKLNEWATIGMKIAEESRKLSDFKK